MTMDFNDRRATRDEDLVKGLCGAARNLRHEMREWVQQEVNTILVEAQLLEGRLGGEVAAALVGMIERLRAINNTELRDAVVALDDVVTQVLNGGYTDVLDAHVQLRNGCVGFEHILGQLQPIRDFIVEWRDA